MWTGQNRYFRRKLLIRQKVCGAVCWQGKSSSARGLHFALAQEKRKPGRVAPSQSAGLDG
jgi:hypothetical protein